jgi:hypothetical protein
VGKKYNKCKIHHNPKNNKICRCDLQELTLGECKLCNERCCSRRTLARCDEENSGPFEYGELNVCNNIDGKNQYDNIALKMAEELKNRSYDEVRIEYSTRLPSLCKTTTGVKDIAKAEENEKNKRENNERC